MFGRPPLGDYYNNDIFAFELRTKVRKKTIQATKMILMLLYYVVLNDHIASRCMQNCALDECAAPYISDTPRLALLLHFAT